VLDEVTKNIYTSSRFRVICKNSDHLSNLIQVYKLQKDAKQNANFIKQMEECLKFIQEIEKKVT
jgi:predicted amidophosphoribosyltransferase